VNALPTRAGVALQYIGVVALLIAGLQPVILGGLAGAGRLTVPQIGVAATAELLALGLACGIAAAFLKPSAMRIKLAAACVGHALCNLGSLWVSGGELIALRSLTGVFAGIMLWATIGMIARSTHPERQAGIFVTLQTLAQLLLAAVLPRTVMVEGGVNAALACLAAISLTAAVAAVWAPPALRPLPKAETAGGGSLTPLAWAGLAAVFLYMAFIVAIWVYLEPLALRVGLTPAQAQGAVAAALAMQVLGGAAATFLGGRLSPPAVLVGAGLINLGLLAGLAASPTATAFMGLVAAFGFLWLFVLPFHTALLIRIDPTRHAAMQLGAAQLLGSSAGPLAASLLVGDSDVAGAMRLAGVCLVLALGLIVVVAARLRRIGKALPAA
jgi:hypothetical protein